MKRSVIGLALVAVTVASGLACLAQTSDGNTAANRSRRFPSVGTPLASVSDKPTFKNVVESVMALNQQVISQQGGKIVHHQPGLPPVTDTGEEQGVLVTGFFYVEGCRENYKPLVPYEYQASVDWNDETHRWKVRGYKIEGNPIDFDEGLEISPRGVEIHREASGSAASGPCQESAITAARQALEEYWTKKGFEVEFTSEEKVGVFHFLRREMDDQEIRKSVNTNTDLHVLGTCQIRRSSSGQRLAVNGDAYYRCTLRWKFEPQKWDVKEFRMEYGDRQETLSRPGGTFGLYPR